MAVEMAGKNGGKMAGKWRENWRNKNLKLNSHFDAKQGDRIWQFFTNWATFGTSI